MSSGMRVLKLYGSNMPTPGVHIGSWCWLRTIVLLSRRRQPDRSPYLQDLLRCTLCSNKRYRSNLCLSLTNSHVLNSVCCAG